MPIVAYRSANLAKYRKQVSGYDLLGMYFSNFWNLTQIIFAQPSKPMPIEQKPFTFTTGGYKAMYPGHDISYACLLFLSSLLMMIAGTLTFLVENPIAGILYNPRLEVSFSTQCFISVLLLLRRCGPVMLLV